MEEQASWRPSFHGRRGAWRHHQKAPEDPVQENLEIADDADAVDDSKTVASMLADQPLPEGHEEATEETDVAPVAEPVAEEEEQQPQAAEPQPEVAEEKAPAEDKADDKYVPQLAILKQMGFVHDNLNLWVLNENNGNVQESALALIKLQNA